MKVYRLHADTENYACFLQSRDNGQKSIHVLAFQQNWEPFHEPLPNITLQLHRSDNGRRNYRFDVSTMTGGLIVFSAMLADRMADILEPRGQLLPLETDSKRKKYVGYYPTHAIRECLDLQKSKYTQYERGKVIQRYVLIGDKISDEWLFVIEGGSAVFVTDRFRNRTEELNLQGFSWKHEVEIA